MKSDDLFLDLYPDLSVEERGEKWSYWSTKAQVELQKSGMGDRPQTVQDTAEEINDRNGKDINDHFGWRVAYMMFKFNQSYNDIRAEGNFVKKVRNHRTRT